MKINFPIIGCAMLMASCSGIYKNYERPQTLAQGIDSMYRNTTTDVVKADTASYGNTHGRRCLPTRNCRLLSTRLWRTILICLMLI